MIPNLKVVLISPLFRTMQTAYNTFRHHPNFKNIKFIMVPDLRPNIDAVYNIPQQLVLTVNDFKKLLPNLSTELLSFHVPYLNKLHDLWFIENMEPKLRYIYKCAVLNKDLDKFNTYNKKILEMIRHKEVVETKETLKNRTERAKEYVIKVLK